MRQLLVLSAVSGRSSARTVAGLGRHFWRLWLIAVAVSLPASCSLDEDPDDPSKPKGPDFEVQYRTKYIDIAPGFTQPVCRGTLDELDRHVEHVAEQLDITVEDRIKVFWYNRNATGAIEGEDAAFSSWCWVSFFGGCYTKGVVHAHFSTLAHELNHAVAAPAWGWSSVFFSEGVAYAFDRSHADNMIHHTPSSKSRSEVMEAKQADGGHFTRWLVDRHGPAKLRELFEASNLSSSTDEMFAVVEQVYGVPVAELEAEYVATAPTIYPMLGLCENLVEVPWTGDRWELRLDADCDAPYMFGPTNGGSMLLVVTIDVPSEFVDVELGSWIPSGHFAEVWPCVEEPLHDVDVELFRGTAIFSTGTSRFRKAGRHRVELRVDEPGEVYARVCRYNGAWPVGGDKSVDPENCLD
jgi:hypothetical protein